MNLPRLAIFILLLPTVAAAQETVQVSVGERQLFLDDHGIAQIDDLERTMHQPTKRGAVIQPDQPWESALQTRCAPVWDDQATRYKLWLITSTPVEGVAGTTYAESLDGVKWTKPILRQWKFQESLENNFIAVEPDSSWPGNAMENVIYDPDDEDPQRRRVVVRMRVDVLLDASRSSAPTGSTGRNSTFPCCRRRTNRI